MNSEKGNKYKSKKNNFEKKKYQSEIIDFNEKISFNENEYRKRTKMGQNSFTAAVNEDLKIYKFENPAGRNLCFSNAITTVILNIQGIQDMLTGDFPMLNQNSVFKVLKSHSEVPNNTASSTKSLRRIVQDKCLRNQQNNRNFDNNRQFDAAEFF